MVTGTTSQQVNAKLEHILTFDTERVPNYDHPVVPVYV